MSWTAPWPRLRGRGIPRREERRIRGRLRSPLPITYEDLGRPVRKVGRTTGVTSGSVTQVEVDRLRVDLGEEGDPHEALFSDQFEVQGPEGRAFSDAGDSGSLIVDEQRRPRGLLFSGGPDTGGRISPLPTASRPSWPSSASPWSADSSKGAGAAGRLPKGGPSDPLRRSRAACPPRGPMSLKKMLLCSGRRVR